MVFLLPVKSLGFLKVLKVSETSIMLCSDVLQADLAPHKEGVPCNMADHNFNIVSLLRPQGFEEVSPSLRDRLCQNDHVSESDGQGETY